MSYMKKTKKAPKASSHGISYEEAERELMAALKAEPKDIKVPISLRLDGDVYLELKSSQKRSLANIKDS